MAVIRLSYLFRPIGSRLFRFPISALSIYFLIVSGLHAAPPEWIYNPAAAARAHYSGGWSASCNLGQVNASPEFNFPLQLVYFTGREQDGIFGSQWFCPQLESSLMPVAKGFLLWTMPSGQQTLLEQAKGGQRDYRSQDHLWRAENSKGSFKISNQDGWQFHYAKGRLIAVISPTLRILEFEWNKRLLIGVRLTDTAVVGHLLLLHLVYGENERVSGLKIHGKAHKFAYLKDATDDRLSAWAPPAGEITRFLYQPESGVLWKAGIGNTGDPAGIETFKTKFVDPVNNGALADESASKRRPSNY